MWIKYVKLRKTLPKFNLKLTAITMHICSYQ